MKVIVIGDVLGSEVRNGTLDSGQPWNSHDLVVLEGMETTKVSVKEFTGTMPTRGEFVAIECEARVSYGKLKVAAVKRLPEVEAVYTKAAAK